MCVVLNSNEAHWNPKKKSSESPYQSSKNCLDIIAS